MPSSCPSFVCYSASNIFLSTEAKEYSKSICLIDNHFFLCIPILCCSSESLYQRLFFLSFYILCPAPLHFLFSSFVPRCFPPLSLSPSWAFFFSHNHSALITLMALMIHLNGALSLVLRLQGHFLCSLLTQKCFLSGHNDGGAPAIWPHDPLSLRPQWDKLTEALFNFDSLGINVVDVSRKGNLLLTICVKQTRVWKCLNRREYLF